MEGNHEAIIKPAVFDKVQEEIKKRGSASVRTYHSASIFSARVKCGDCGGYYGPKIWHSNEYYRKTVFRCNRKYNGEKKCTTSHLSEDEIKEIFVKALNRLSKDKNDTIADMRELKEMVCNTIVLEQELQAEMNKMKALDAQIQNLITENAQLL